MGTLQKFLKNIPSPKPLMSPLESGLNLLSLAIEK